MPFYVKHNAAPPEPQRDGHPVEFFDWWLRGTTWAHKERRQAFATRALAEAAFARAKPFMRRSAARAAQIVEEP